MNRQERFEKTIKTVAKKTGFSESRVRKTAEELKERGFLDVPLKDVIYNALINNEEMPKYVKEVVCLLVLNVGVMRDNCQEFFLALARVSPKITKEILCACEDALRVKPEQAGQVLSSWFIELLEEEEKKREIRREK